MEYSKLVSVTGLPGLYELIASKSDGAIVRSLDDKSTRFVSSRIHNFSHLESIEVYTEGDNVNLVDVFHAMQNSSEKLPDEKDPKAVKAYFEKTYPSMDFSRVYSSDMKKMVRWYEVLTKNNIEIKLTEEPDEEATAVAATEQEAEEVVVATPEKTKPAKNAENKKSQAGEGEIAVAAKKERTAKAKKATGEDGAESETNTPKKKAAKK
ncbi:MAG: DUF5606 domain-containing protein [Bacteroidetes bacterium]|nr:DUF5606 domain-containing protein [Bacteroidota bacterium]